MKSSNSNIKIKMPVAMGFYPANKDSLDREIDRLMSGVKSSKTGDRPLAIIVPHAGYIYSGPVAAEAYSLIKDASYKNVIVIGPSHYIPFDGSALPEEDYFRTPLGDIRVSDEIRNEINVLTEKISIYPDAFAKEHSVEVQIPFLQKSLGGDFNLIPIVMGNPSPENVEVLGRALAKIVSDHPETLLVASSDMSHYYPYDVANSMDSTALKSIVKLDDESLARDIEVRKCELCGEGPVLAVLRAVGMLGAKNSKLLKYANSGDTAGDKSRVVGYCALAIYSVKAEKNSNGAAFLNGEERRKLLRLARNSIKAHLTTGGGAPISETSPVENRKRGAFVTLTENGQLRGCIGYTEPVFPLWQTVSKAAIASATQDPRFYPLGKDELSKIEIEVSVLTPLVKVNNINEIEVGTHGLVIKKDGYTGLLLPQVASDYRWNLNQFLEATCQKAGLPSDAWKGGAEIYKFSAEVFNEGNLK